MSLIATLQGYNGDVYVYADAVLIRPKGLGSRLLRGSTGDKRVAISSISAVQIKKPGLTSGFIQFTISGETAFRGGAYNAAQDENAVILKNHDQYMQALRVQQAIEQARSAASRPAPPPAPTPASVPMPDDPIGRLERLKGLLDAGAINQAEFDSAKAAILRQMQ